MGSMTCPSSPLKFIIGPAIPIFKLGGQELTPDQTFARLRLSKTRRSHDVDTRWNFGSFTRTRRSAHFWPILGGSIRLVSDSCLEGCRELTTTRLSNCESKQEGLSARESQPYPRCPTNQAWLGCTFWIATCGPLWQCHLNQWPSQTICHSITWPSRPLHRP